MSQIKNGGTDQYCTEPFEQHQFGTAGIEGVKSYLIVLQTLHHLKTHTHTVLALFNGLVFMVTTVRPSTQPAVVSETLGDCFTWLFSINFSQVLYRSSQPDHSV